MGAAESRRGMAMPLTIVAMVVVIGFIMTMSRMNQGVKSQIFHTNNHQLSFQMAYSALSRVCAKIHAFSWGNRPFATDPYVENKVDLQGGQYDLLVENSKNRDFQADVYVRTHLAGISRLYFWRIRFNDDLLDVSNQIFIEAFLTGSPQDFPVPGKANPFASKVEAMLAKRAANQKKSDLVASEILKKKKPNEIIKELNGRPIEPLDENFPMSPEDIEIARKDPVTLPQMPPLTAAEKPTAPGPNPTKPVAPNDSMVGIDMESQRAKVVQSSESAFKLTDEGWKKMEEKGVEGFNEAYQLHELAAAAREDAYKEMSGLIAGARTGIADAPSAGAAGAIEEMVSQTIVAGVKNLAAAMGRGMDQFKDNAGPEYLGSLNSAEDVAKLTTDWENAMNHMANEVQRMTSLSNQISSFQKAGEVAEALATTLEKAQADLDKMTQLVDSAKKRLDELIKKEEEEAASQQQGNSEEGL